MRVVVDCDPGQDDAIAIAVAAHRCELVGIVSVAGNVGLEHTTHNALVLSQLLATEGLHVPVHAGAAGPLVGDTYDAAHVHGESGLAGAVLPELTGSLASDDGAGFLVKASRQHDDLWLIAIGPLTNVAHAIQRDPGFTGRLAGISIMGGGTVGNATAAAEFNIYADPEAAEIVLGSGARIVMCGLDLTRQVNVTQAMVDEVAALPNAFGPFCAGFLQAYLDRVRDLTGASGEAALHDPCAVLAITDPALFQMRPREVKVECLGRHTRGMTLVDQRPWARGGNVEWCETIDAEPALRLIVDSIAAAP
jgi:inosine-uridine nucleoside N-ribohydrolase